VYSSSKILRSLHEALEDLGVEKSGLVEKLRAQLGSRHS
jgi:hypothetical protein